MDHHRVTMWHLWNVYGSLWGHYVAAVESLWVTMVTMWQLWNPCGSLWGHYVAAVESLWVTKGKNGSLCGGDGPQ